MCGEVYSLAYCCAASFCRGGPLAVSDLHSPDLTARGVLLMHHVDRPGASGALAVIEAPMSADRRAIDSPLKPDDEKAVSGLQKEAAAA